MSTEPKIDVDLQTLLVRQVSDTAARMRSGCLNAALYENHCRVR
jgi:hypothetical protein